jgi:hypothetical protein
MSAAAFIRIIDLLKNLDDPIVLKTLHTIIDNRIKALKPDSQPQQLRSAPKRRTVQYSDVAGKGGGGASKNRGRREPHRGRYGRREGHVSIPANQKGCQYGKRCNRQNDKENPCIYNHDIEFKTQRRCRNSDQCKIYTCPYQHPAGWNASPSDDSSESSDDEFIVTTPVVASAANSVVVSDDIETEVALDSDGKANWGE